MEHSEDSSEVKPFATLIPIYRGTLTIAEERRLELTLANSPRTSCFFVGPSSLQHFLSHRLLQSRPFIGFADVHFDSILTYNRWMLMPELYETFEQYEFVVICQLDAVIVRSLPPDLDFGFDFLGAPWVPPINARWIPVLGKMAFSKRSLRPFTRTLYVGNGGLSIRRVEAFRRLTRLPHSSTLPNEDVLISYFHRRLGIQVAPPKLAGQFFMELGSRTWTNKSPVPLVYGFHALSLYNPSLEDKILSAAD